MQACDRNDWQVYTSLFRQLRRCQLLMGRCWAQHPFLWSFYEEWEANSKMLTFIALLFDFNKAIRQVLSWIQFYSATRVPQIPRNIIRSNLAWEGHLRLYGNHTHFCNTFFWGYSRDTIVYESLRVFISNAWWGGAFLMLVTIPTIS